MIQEQQYWVIAQNQSGIDQHEINMATFIAMVTRWDIDTTYGMYKDRKGTPWENVYHAGFIFERFKKDLPREVDKAGYGKAFEIYLKDKFLPMIDRYCQWYDKHKTRLEKFKRDNFFVVMRDLALTTKKEIEKYFQSKKNSDPSYTEYAMALHLRNIRLNKNGYGMDNNVDYLELFGLPLQDKNGKRPETLYKKLNNIQNDRVSDANGDIKRMAQQIIKERNL